MSSFIMAVYCERGRRCVKRKCVNSVSYETGEQYRCPANIYVAAHTTVKIPHRQIEFDVTMNTDVTVNKFYYCT